MFLLFPHFAFRKLIFFWLFFIFFIFLFHTCLKRFAQSCISRLASVFYLLYFCPFFKPINSAEKRRVNRFLPDLNSFCVSNGAENFNSKSEQKSHSHTYDWRAATFRSSSYRRLKPGHIYVTIQIYELLTSCTNGSYQSLAVRTVSLHLSGLFPSDLPRYVNNLHRFNRILFVF